MKKLKVNLRINKEELKKKLDIKDGQTPDTFPIVVEAAKRVEERLTPLIPKIEDIKNELPKLGTKIREGLEILDGEERLDKSAIKGLDEIEKFAKNAKQINYYGGPGIKGLRAGANITIDDTKINFPIISATGGAGGDHNHTSDQDDGGVLTNDEHDGFSEYTEISEPSAPSADKLRLYTVDQNGFIVIEAKGATGLTRRLARDNYIIAKVAESSGVGVGKAVYISGAVGANEQIKLAKANNIGTMPAIGLTIDAGANNDFVRILVVGKLSGLPSQFSDGDRVFVSADTAGELVNVEPISPNISQRMGFITRTSGFGEILVASAGLTNPGGSDTEVQFNNVGTFGGDSGLVYNKTYKSLYAGSLATILPGTITRSGSYVSSVALTGGRTLTITRSGNYISSVTDGNKTWNYTRTANLISSWSVT
jgi:hypothetical protein